MVTFSRTQRVLLLSLTFVLLAVGVPVLRATLVPPADAAATLQQGPVYLPYNPRLASAYAQQYVIPGGGATSAVFVACALNAAGITALDSGAPWNGRQTCTVDTPTSTANAIAAWSQMIPSFNPPIFPAGWSRLSDRSLVREGDLVFIALNDTTVPCLGGIIAASQPVESLAPGLISDPGQLSFYMHSFVENNNSIRERIIPFTSFGEEWRCDINRPTTDYSVHYIRINADFTPPVLPTVTPVALDYTGAPQTVAWPEATDGEAGMGTYQLQDGAGSALTEPTTAAEAPLNPGMCSETAYTIVAADAVGNAATTSLTVRTFHQGDFNRDGLIDDTDYDQLERWIDGTETPPPPHADLTGDGAVTIDDLLLLTLRLGESCSVREEGGV